MSALHLVLGLALAFPALAAAGPSADLAAAPCAKRPVARPPDLQIPMIPIRPMARPPDLGALLGSSGIPPDR